MGQIDPTWVKQTEILLVFTRTRQRPEYASQGTCHKCAAPLGRGSRAHKRCGRCGVTYHTTDCGQRYSVLDNPTAYNLEDCPKVNKLLRIPSSPLPASSTRSRPLI